ncbi:hypothetical protein [Luteibacter sp. Lutesp34]|uniref:hypothetical protein n=1 Tax=Luteibacter sp. Lutesp34 TaxID=3243030 RepID=UPI0039B6528D
MKRTFRALAAALGIACLATQAYAQAPDARMTAFDAHAGAPLPIRFDLPAPAGGHNVVLLLEKLHSEVELDGETARIFLAEIDGRPGTIVRTGDSLDIALDDDVDAGRPPFPGEADGEQANDLLSVPPQEQLARRARGDETDAPDELHVWMFLHDAAGESSRGAFLNRYVSWWVRDMEQAVRVGVPVRVTLRSAVPGITDMDYHAGSSIERLRELRDRGRAYVRAQGGKITSLTKFMLFVGKPPANLEGGTVGAAIEPFGAAVASSEGHRHVVAHELGHLLGATHEDAENRFFCITNMKDSLWGAIPCRYYSGTNDGNIRRYVRARTGV